MFFIPIKDYIQKQKSIKILLSKAIIIRLNSSFRKTYKYKLLYLE